jgi:hypothetical protein
MSVKKVHVVFKTHLDIGFTDLARPVVDHYLEKYIQAAIACAESVNQPGSPPMFIWTVGAYLIDLALRVYPKDRRDALDKAVRRGHITYHALPFTTHSELCTPALFEAGLGIAARLDRLYGRRTIAAKMSDVPGHTMGIIAPMAQRGIEYLHIGINSVAGMPKAPPIFVWENAAGQSLIVNYCRSYGGITEVPGHDEALCFLHSEDNMGPPSREYLEKEFETLRARYPDAEICASTLNDYAAGLKKIRGELPIIREEIGDTWIHGVGSDPQKVSALRALLRLDEAWQEDGTWEKQDLNQAGGRTTREAFLEELLLICEHTWGLDAKKYLADYVNWNRRDFDKARKADLLKDAYGQAPGCQEYFNFAKTEFLHLPPAGLTWEKRSYSFFESSHEEQRQYLTLAANLLPGPMREKALAVILRPETAPPQAARSFTGQDEGLLSGVKLSKLRVEYQPEGSVAVSPDSPGGAGLLIGAVQYQEVGREAYRRFGERFLCNLDKYRLWAIPDNFKPGLEASDAPMESVIHRPHMEASMHSIGGSPHFGGAYPKEASMLAGCPERFEAAIHPMGEGKLLMEIWLRDKPRNRKPEALFLPITFPEQAKLEIQKIGTWIDPKHVLEGGNRRVHAVQRIRVTGPEGNGWLLEPLDTPLVVFEKPELLDFSLPETWDTMYLALYNNLWGTNFKMWYGEDILCRMMITYEKGRGMGGE